jgi:hypothetical protein
MNRIASRASAGTKQGRRHHGMVRRLQATQFTKNRMRRPSSRITGSKLSTSSLGKKPDDLVEERGFRTAC